MSAESKELLENWLNEQMETELPGAKERLAAAEAAAASAGAAANAKNAR